MLGDLEVVDQPNLTDRSSRDVTHAMRFHPVFFGLAFFLVIMAYMQYILQRLDEKSALAEATRLQGQCPVGDLRAFTLSFPKAECSPSVF